MDTWRTRKLRIWAETSNINLTTEKNTIDSDTMVGCGVFFTYNCYFVFSVPFFCGLEFEWKFHTVDLMGL